jgi:cyclic pyranopterin phosphate synthase
MALVDSLARPLRSLRVSVTDRCNLRCQYCMPEQEYRWLPREDLLHFEEICRLVEIFVSLGVDKVRLTGGEPLLRRDLADLVRLLAAVPGIDDLALTTNGVLLADQAEALAAAGLARITVSLDTLRPDRFYDLTRQRNHDRVLTGIASAARLFGGLKIDTVIMRGVNDDELVPMLAYGRELGAEVRFIEYMDVGGATRWSMARVVSRQELLHSLEQHFGSVTAIREETAAPASRFALPGGQSFGIIASTTSPFCGACDRSRLTADGLWYLCLYAAEGTDLRQLLRGGAGRDRIEQVIREKWIPRADRGAELRMAEGHRTAFIPVEALKKEPHLEMHTRGG